MKLLLGKLFHLFHGRLAGTKPDTAVGNFSIISRRVVHELRLFREGRRNYGMQVGWLGFPTAFIDVEHAARHSGKTTYSFSRQLRHAIATVLQQSTRPLYASAGIGFAMALGAAGTGGYFIVRKIATGSAPEGWTSVIVSMFFLFGIMFVNLSVLGLYLGSVFDEVKGRPPFVVEKTTDGGTASR